MNNPITKRLLKRFGLDETTRIIWVPWFVKPEEYDNLKKIVDESQDGTTLTDLGVAFFQEIEVKK